jgi:flagellar basal body-associated protein FliL
MILAIVNLLATLGIVGLLGYQFKKEQSHEGMEDLAAETGHGDAGGHGEAAAGGHGEAAGGHGEAAAGGHGEAAAGGHGAPAGGHAPSSVNYGKMIQLDQFMVNLSTPGSSSPKFVRVNISLEVPTADVETEVNAKMPQVRNAVIDLFNSKTPKDLSTADGREYLKEELRNAINGFMVQGKVKGVFFTNFSLGGG